MFDDLLVILDEVVDKALEVIHEASKDSGTTPIEDNDYTKVSAVIVPDVADGWPTK